MFALSAHAKRALHSKNTAFLIFRAALKHTRPPQCRNADKSRDVRFFENMPRASRCRLSPREHCRNRRTDDGGGGGDGAVTVRPNRVWFIIMVMVVMASLILCAPRHSTRSTSLCALISKAMFINNIPARQSKLGVWFWIKKFFISRRTLGALVVLTWSFDVCKSTFFSHFTFWIPISQFDYALRKKNKNENSHNALIWKRLWLTIKGVRI